MNPPTPPNNAPEPIFVSAAFGEITIGTEVTFQVENDDQWTGDRVGTLVFHEGAFKIQTARSGLLIINKRYGPYGNTIRPTWAR